MSEYEKTISDSDHQSHPAKRTRKGDFHSELGVKLDAGVIIDWKCYEKAVKLNFFKPSSHFGSVWHCQKGCYKLRWIYGKFRAKDETWYEGHLFVKVGRIR